MARLLAYTSPATGHVLPSMAVVLELHRRGHEVHVRTREPEVTLLRELGLHAETIDPHIDEIEIDDWKGRNWIDALERLQRAFARRAALEVPDIQQAIGETRPDALVVDVACEGAGFTAEASGLPWAQFCPHPPVFGSRDAPPYGPGLRPGDGPIARARDRVLRAVLQPVADRHLPPLNHMRGELGLAPMAHLEEVFLRATRCILFTAEPYEYPRSDWPDNVRLVGPVSWAPPSVPSWLVEETRPIVLVTASTVRQADERLIATALEALAGEDLSVIVTTGAHDPDDFAPSENARVERFAPHDPIIERAACVVSHGGQGITQKALAAGVPVCVVPFCRDQFEVARRVEVSQAGTRLHHKRLNAKRLRATVHATIAKRPGAERVAASFADAGGASAATDAIEELLPTTPRADDESSPQSSPSHR